MGAYRVANKNTKWGREKYQRVKYRIKGALIMGIVTQYLLAVQLELSEEKENPLKITSIPTSPSMSTR